MRGLDGASVDRDSISLSMAGRGLRSLQLGSGGSCGVERLKREARRHRTRICAPEPCRTTGDLAVKDVPQYEAKRALIVATCGTDLD